jgi:antitoxin component YwqK of YwqJK toxin-antitoxin module
MIGIAPPGMTATCVPDERSSRAMFVPDAKKLTAGTAACGDGGYLESAVPALNGRPNGLATSYFEDGRVRAQTPYVDGAREGLEIKLRNDEGEPQRTETPFHHGVSEGVVRYYARDGRLADEIPFQNGRRHGLDRQYLPSGGVSEEWTWNDDRVTSIRVFDSSGNIVARQDYGTYGVPHGTFCRPNHHCSEW